MGFSFFEKKYFPNKLQADNQHSVYPCNSAFDGYNTADCSGGVWIKETHARFGDVSGRVSTAAGRFRLK